ncbi:MAG: UDP-3-O-(3-hydroxymyristoyl)glucosamine N-acyltransferase [Deltaproteobacteria bacterium]|jgi:UDP-3-O-[3-hydroxymyristoyl] glucosamine N-acyltransferase|nr:UDP-3-O-(3-hydroxymyristoyl)glucosamine N-acyltransferase [Deltaproteobacteria bacterium]
MSEYTLADLAEKLGLALRGENGPVRGLNTLEAAGPDEVSFLANPKYAAFLETTRAAAVIVDEEHAGKVKRALISRNPYLDFGRALALFARREGSLTGISSEASIHPEAVIGENCTVYPFAFVGARAKVGEGCTLFPGSYVGEDCVVRARCILYPNAVLLSRVELGEGCEIMPGAVIGADGYGFIRNPGGGGIQRIPQAGFVRLGREVRVGSNSTIDRGALSATRIGDETKIDNLVQIGHNVSVGRENLIVAQVGLAGSTSIGDRGTFAGQVGVAGHLKIGNDVIVGPQAGVAQDVPDGFSGGGTPLVDSRTFMRTLASMPGLPELFKRVSRLEKQLAALGQERDDAGKSDKEQS